RIRATEPALVERLGQETSEGSRFRSRRDDEDDAAPFRAHGGSLGDLRLLGCHFPVYHETRESLNPQPLRGMLVDVGAYHDSCPVADHEGAPAFQPVPPCGPPVVDRQTHGLAVSIEEACVDRDDGRIGRDDFFYPTPRGRSSGGNQTELR